AAPALLTSFFFSAHAAAPATSTLSLHDALPIYPDGPGPVRHRLPRRDQRAAVARGGGRGGRRAGGDGEECAGGGKGARLPRRRGPLRPRDAANGPADRDADRRERPPPLRLRAGGDAAGPRGGDGLGGTRVGGRGLDHAVQGR